MPRFEILVTFDTGLSWPVIIETDDSVEAVEGAMQILGRERERSGPASDAAHFQVVRIEVTPV